MLEFNQKNSPKAISEREGGKGERRGREGTEEREGRGKGPSPPRKKILASPLFLRFEHHWLPATFRMMLMLCSICSVRIFGLPTEHFQRLQDNTSSYIPSTAYMREPSFRSFLYSWPGAPRPCITRTFSRTIWSWPWTSYSNNRFWERCYKCIPGSISTSYCQRLSFPSKPIGFTQG